MKSTERGDHLSQQLEEEFVKIQPQNPKDRFVDFVTSYVESYFWVPLTQ